MTGWTRGRMHRAFISRARHRGDRCGFDGRNGRRCARAQRSVPRPDRILNVGDRHDIVVDRPAQDDPFSAAGYGALGTETEAIIASRRHDILLRALPQVRLT